MYLLLVSSIGLCHVMAYCSLRSRALVFARPIASQIRHRLAFFQSVIMMQVKSISRDDLKTYLERWVRPDGAILGVLGSLIFSLLQLCLVTASSSILATAQPSRLLPHQTCLHDFRVTVAAQGDIIMKRAVASGSMNLKRHSPGPKGIAG